MSECLSSRKKKYSSPESNIQKHHSSVDKGKKGYRSDYPVCFSGNDDLFVKPDNVENDHSSDHVMIDERSDIFEGSEPNITEYTKQESIQINAKGSIDFGSVECDARSTTNSYVTSASTPKNALNVKTEKPCTKSETNGPKTTETTLKPAVECDEESKSVNERKSEEFRLSLLDKLNSSIDPNDKRVFHQKNISFMVDAITKKTPDYYYLCDRPKNNQIELNNWEYNIINLYREVVLDNLTINDVLSKYGLPLEKPDRFISERKHVSGKSLQKSAWDGECEKMQKTFVDGINCSRERMQNAIENIRHCIRRMQEDCDRRSKILSTAATYPIGERASNNGK
jgi:hypothetical protein